LIGPVRVFEPAATDEWLERELPIRQFRMIGRERTTNPVSATKLGSSSRQP
jgi:hypothetical protein